MVVKTIQKRRVKPRSRVTQKSAAKLREHSTIAPVVEIWEPMFPAGSGAAMEEFINQRAKNGGKDS